MPYTTWSAAERPRYGQLAGAGKGKKYGKRQCDRGRDETHDRDRPQAISAASQHGIPAGVHHGREEDESDHTDRHLQVLCSMKNLARASSSTSRKYPPRKVFVMFGF